MNNTTANIDVAVLIGSLRATSISRRLAHAVSALAPKSLSLRIVEIGEQPLYNFDLETAAPPAPWVKFREEIKRADALLFVTPEFNRSIPGALKNAIDVGSRPKGASVWKGKPGGVISQSPGRIGGFGANHHLRQSLAGVDVAVMPFPETYIGFSEKVLANDGSWTDPDARALLADFMKSFEAWVGRSLRSLNEGAT